MDNKINFIESDWDALLVEPYESLPECCHRITDLRVVIAEIKKDGLTDSRASRFVKLAEQAMSFHTLGWSHQLVNMYEYTKLWREEQWEYVNGEYGYMYY